MCCFLRCGSSLPSESQVHEIFELVFSRESAERIQIKGGVLLAVIGIFPCLVFPLALLPSEVLMQWRQATEVELIVDMCLGHVAFNPF
jgi:hypothetical protein